MSAELYRWENPPDLCTLFLPWKTRISTPGLGNSRGNPRDPRFDTPHPRRAGGQSRHFKKSKIEPARARVKPPFLDISRFPDSCRATACWRGDPVPAERCDRITRAAQDCSHLRSARLGAGRPPFPHMASGPFFSAHPIRVRQLGCHRSGCACRAPHEIRTDLDLRLPCTPGTLLLEVPGDFGDDGGVAADRL